MRLVALVCAATPDPVNLLGHVDDLEPARKRTNKIARQFGGKFVEQASQFAVVMLRRLAPPNRGTTRGFDVLIKRIAALFAQQFSELLAEKVDVTPQAGILGCELDAFPIESCAAGRHVR